MNDNLFQPKSGKAQWEIVIAIFEKMNIGDKVTYEEVLAALGTDFPRASMHTVVGHAIRKFRDRKRTFENVRGEGWRMVEASEHSRLARKQQLKSKRRLADAVSISAATDLSRLDPEQRRAQRSEELHLRRLLDQVSRRMAKVEERMEKTEQRVAVVEKGSLSTEEKVDQLTALLRRHGIKNDED